jgi:hypothetical protein
VSTDQEIDDLFSVPPDRFTSARDELARRLSGADSKEEAAEIKKLRKPTLSAWALNQLPRRYGKELAQLVEAGEALRTAQRKAASGMKDSGFQDAANRRRKAVGDLTSKGIEVLSEQGKPSQSAEAEIGRALEAASVDTEAGEQLLRGRLSKPISTVPGFDSVGGFEVIAGAQQDGSGRGPGKTATQVALGNAERQASKAEADAHRARMRADTLREEAAELMRRAESAAREAEDLERASERAAEKLERARREADES